NRLWPAHGGDGAVVPIARIDCTHKMLWEFGQLSRDHRQAVAKLTRSDESVPVQEADLAGWCRSAIQSKNRGSEIDGRARGRRKWCVRETNSRQWPPGCARMIGRLSSRGRKGSRCIFEITRWLPRPRSLNW